MPLYEYQCENCGEVFELMQKFADEPTTIHEKCGGKVHRLLSAPALQFKGSGWYITDYAKGGSSSSSSSSANSESGKNDSSKKESSTAKTDSSSTPAAAPSSTPSSTSDK